MKVRSRSRASIQPREGQCYMAAQIAVPGPLPRSTRRQGCQSSGTCAHGGHGTIELRISRRQNLRIHLGKQPMSKIEKQKTKRANRPPADSASLEVFLKVVLESKFLFLFKLPFGNGRTAETSVSVWRSQGVCTN
jgi:hypothetical protein